MKLYLGETIKRLRQQNGLTQEQLADKLGVSFQSISRWEGGASYPDIELIPEIAGFFRVTTDELMGLDKSLREKKLEEALLQLVGNVPLEERVKIQRQIHRDFPHDSGVLYGLIHTLGELCEEGREREYYEELKQFAEEYLALPAETTYQRDFIKTELITAAPEEEVEDMLGKYAGAFDMRPGALLKKRYEYRGDRERCEAQIQANLIDTVHGILFEGIPEGTTPEEAAGIQTKALRILNILIGREETALIPPTPDLWCLERIRIGVRLAMALCRIPGKEDASLDVLELTVTLTENAFALPEGTVLTAQGLPFISARVSSSPPVRLFPFRHPQFVYTSREKEFGIRHVAFRSQWLDRPDFDPIRGNPRFLSCAERIEKVSSVDRRDPY